MASSPAIACTSAVPLLTTAYGGMVSLWHLENTECLRRSVGPGREPLKCCRVLEAEQRRPGGQQMNFSPTERSQSDSLAVEGISRREEGSSQGEISPLQIFHSTPVHRLSWLRSSEKNSGLLACLTGRGIHLYRVTVPSHSNASILGTATPGQLGSSCYAIKGIFSSYVVHTDFVNECLFAAGRLVTASDDQTAKTWDVETAANESVVRCTSPAVALTKNSRNSAIFAIGESAGAVSCYDTRAKRIALRFRALTSGSGRLHDVDWSSSSDSTTFAIAAGDSWSLWDIRVPKASFLDQTVAHSSPVKQIKWSSTHNKLFATSSKEEVKLWDCSNPHTALVAIASEEEQSIGSIGWLPDSATCCFTDGKMLRFCPVRM